MATTERDYCLSMLTSLTGLMGCLPDGHGEIGSIAAGRAQDALTSLRADAAELVLMLARMQRAAEAREQAADARLAAGKPAVAELAARVVRELATPARGEGEIVKAERKLVADLGEVLA